MEKVLVDYGISGAILCILLIIVKWFTKFIEEQNKQTMSLIENHLKHNTEALNELKKSINDLRKFLNGGRCKQ